MTCEQKLTIPSTVQVSILWGNVGAQARNVTHGTITAGTSVDVTMANSILASLVSLQASSGLQAQLAGQGGIEGVTVRDLRDVDFAELISTLPGSPGTAAGEPMPQQIASVISLKTAKAGKHNRGRMYIPGWSEDANDVGAVMTAAAQAALQAFADGLQGAYLSGLVTLGVAQRPLYDLDTCVITTPGVTNAVTQAVVRNGFWDTQRRRAGRT
jgi:hypothetical protein